MYLIIVFVFVFVILFFFGQVMSLKVQSKVSLTHSVLLNNSISELNWLKFCVLSSRQDCRPTDLLTNGSNLSKQWDWCCWIESCICFKLFRPHPNLQVVIWICLWFVNSSNRVSLKIVNSPNSISHDMSILQTVFNVSRWFVNSPKNRLFLKLFQVIPPTWFFSCLIITLFVPSFCDFSIIIWASFSSAFVLFKSFFSFATCSSSPLLSSRSCN